MSRRRRENKGKDPGRVNNLSKPETKYLDDIIKILVIMVIGIVPILVRCEIQQYISPVIDPALNFFSTGLTDYFTYFKFMVMLPLCVLILALFAVKVFGYRYELKTSMLNIALAAFILALILSMLLSDYKSIALWGGYGKSFGALTYIACAVLLLGTAGVKWQEKWYKYALSALYLPVAVNAIMVVMNFLGYNLMDFDLLRVLTAGEVKHFQMTGTALAGTLGHNNYISGFGGVSFALFASKAVLRDKNRYIMIMDLVAAVLSGVIVYGSDSLSGLVTLVFSAILLLGWLIEQKDKKGLIIYLGIGLATSGSWLGMIQHDPSFLKDIITSASFVVLPAVGSCFLLLAYFLWKNKARFAPKHLKIMAAAFAIVLIVFISAIGPIAVQKISEQSRRFDSQSIIQRLRQDEFALPEIGVAWGSGRVYIWKEAVKLIAQKPLFGYGLDTLVIEFNQGDPAKLAALENSQVIVDKTHNVYLNLLYGAGIIAFIAYLCIVLIVMKGNIKTIVQNKETIPVLLPLLFGILAYLCQGMFNDPAQGFESTFWVLLGISYSLTQTQAEELRPVREKGGNNA